jgi:outer membrane protein insertion porin family
VRNINVAGNTRTRDVVVRREFRQLEASWYDGEKIRKSRDRVDRLGYFGEVAIETQEVPGTPDQLDLTVNVVEKPTGSLSLGAGYSSGDGLGISFGLKQENAFGSGNSLGIQLNTSKINRLMVLNTTDPYFTEDGVSRTLDLYYRTNRPYQDQDAYEIDTAGASIRFGVPFSETDTVFFGLGVENTEIVSGTQLPESYRQFVAEYGTPTMAVPFTVGWSRDSRDSSLAPSSGRFQRANAEWSFAGDVRYLRATYQFQQYVPLSKQFTAAFNVDIGAGASGSDKTYPVFKNFFGGGLGSVRGFEQGSLGPVDIYGTNVGGDKKFNLNMEILAPLPGAGNDRTLRLYGFWDMGLIAGPDQGLPIINANANELRSAVGVGISWISPMGPLRLAFSKPVRSYKIDRTENVQFQIGTSF